MVLYSTTECSCCDESHTNIVCEKCGSLFCSEECKRDNHTNEWCNDVSIAGGPEKFYTKCLVDTTAETITRDQLVITEELSDVCCYICYGKDKDGLIKNGNCENICYVHLSCLTKYIKSIVDRSIDDGSTDNWQTNQLKWTECGVCRKNYSGLFKFTMSCNCWDFYVLHNNVVKKCFAMNEFACGFLAIKSFEEALNVFDALINLMMKNGLTSSRLFLVSQINMACCLKATGQEESAKTLSVKLLKDITVTMHNKQNITPEFIISILSVAVITENNSGTLQMMITLRKFIDTNFKASELSKRFYYVYALILHDHYPVNEKKEVDIILDTLDDIIQDLKVKGLDNDEDTTQFKEIFSKLGDKHALRSLAGLFVGNFRQPKQCTL